MQFAPTVGMGEGGEPGLWGLRLGGLLVLGDPPVGSGGQRGSFAQCVLWVLLGTPGSMLDPGRSPLSPTQAPPSLLPPNANPVGRCQGAGGAMQGEGVGGPGWALPRAAPASPGEGGRPRALGGVVIVVRVVVVGRLAQLRV